MKKSLIALAALAAVSAASAQSTLNMTGTFSPNYNSAKTEAANGNSRTANTFENSNIATSRVLFTGSEDLGGGTKAIFLYEMDFDSTSKDTSPLSGEIYVGLTGGFGSLKVGVPNSPTLTTQSGRSGFTSKIGGGRGAFALSGTTVTRQNDAVRYDTPTFGGFSAAVNYTPKVSAAAVNQGFVAAAETTAITDVGGFYTNGPIAAGISNYQQKNVVDQTTLFASYTMGAAKVTLGLHTRDNKKLVADAPANTAAQVVGDALGKSTGYNVALNYSLTPAITLIGNIARTNDKTAYNRDLQLAAIGAEYALSKRTSLHARYVSTKRDNVDGAVAASAGVPTAQKTTLVGIVHNF